MRDPGVQTVEHLIINPGWYGLAHIYHCLKGSGMFELTKKPFWPLQCPDKPNVTNNIVCSSCGGAGHIARDCRQKRPGTGGPNAAGDKNKIDEEVILLYWV